VEAIQDGGSIPPASTYRKGNVTEYKKCSKCSEEKPSTAEFFYKHPNGKNGLRESCKECASIHMIAHRAELLTKRRRSSRARAMKKKKRLVKYLGGKCTFCGYDKCLAAFDFHHINAEEKSFGVGQGISECKKFEALLKEAKKCVLLCANCHRELHDEKRS